MPGWKEVYKNKIQDRTQSNITKKVTVFASNRNEKPVQNSSTENFKRKIHGSARLLNLFDKFYEEKKGKLDNISEKEIQKNFISYLNSNKRFSYLSDKDKYDVLEIISKSTLSTDEKITTLDTLLGDKKNLFIKNLISRKNDVDKKELRAQLRTCFRTYDITRAVWYKREDSRNYLARKAWIENYDPGWTNWWKQNEKIRDWFLDKMLEINEIHVKFNTFLRPELQEVLQSTTMEDKRLISTSEALSALTAEQQANLNLLNKDRFQEFLLVLSKKWDELWIEYKDKLWTSTDVWSDLGKCLVLSRWDIYQSELISIISKDTKRSPQELDSIVSISDSDIVNHFESLGKPIPDKTNSDRQLIKQDIRNKKAEKYTQNNTSKETQEEVKKAKQRYEIEVLKIAYENGFEEELRSNIRWEEYYSQVEQNYISQQQVETQKYQNTESWKEFNKVGQKLMWEKQFLQLFDQNQITSEKLKWDLSDEEYKNLLIENKQEWNPENQQKLQKQREYVLLDTTNNEIKNRFVNRITYFFSNILDVQIDEGGKENILENLKIDQNQIENNQITIQWKYQNQNLTFTYDTITWELFTWKRLHIDDHSQNVSVNNKMVRLENVSWPTFGEHIKQSNSISYSDILKKSEWNQESYAEELNKQLTIKCPLPNQSDDFKEEMKLQSLQNIVSQEVFGMMWVSDKLFLNKSIDWSDNRYEVFPLLARTISSYNKSELNKFRENIKYMSDFYIKTNQLENTENIVSRKLTWLMSKVFPRYRSTKNYVQRIFLDREKNQQKSNYSWKQFHSFFSSFLTWWERLSSDWKNIIDINKFTMFYEDLSQTKKQTESITGDYFTLLNENMDKYYAEDLLDNQNVDNSQTIV